MFHYRHHSYVDDPQYVHNDVFSDVPVASKFYYTHYSDMDDPQYVHFDVFSDVVVA